MNKLVTNATGWQPHILHKTQCWYNSSVEGSSLRTNPKAIWYFALPRLLYETLMQTQTKELSPVLYNVSFYSIIYRGL